jgi:hypothetical protein
MSCVEVIQEAVAGRRAEYKGGLHLLAFLPPPCRHPPHCAGGVGGAAADGHMLPQREL